MACRVEDLPGVGSYVEYRIGDHSILVVRESTDSIRGVLQRLPPPRHAPRHRPRPGRLDHLPVPRLALEPRRVDPARARSARSSCPARTTTSASQPVRVDAWGGFVFINMDPDAEPLLDYLDPIPEVFAPFQFENMRYRWMKSVIAAVQLEDRARRVPRGVPRARARTRSSPAGTSATTTSPR